MRFKPFALLICLCLVAGCANQKKRVTDKENATKQWAGARAAVLGQLAKDQYDSGSFDKSRLTIDEALRLNPDSAQLRLLSAKLAIEQGQLELADRELAAARHSDPKNSEVEYFSGVVYQRWQQPEKALEFYQAAAEKAPGELAYLMAEAETLVSMERPKDALALLQQKVVFFEHSAVIRDAVGEILIGEGRLPEAVDMLRQASILAEDDLAVHVHYALALYFNKQYREAVDALTRLVQNEKCAKRADLFLALGECQLQLNQPRQAWPTFETATQISPNNTQAWTSLAKATLALGDLHRAERSVRRAISIDPASGEAHLLLGYIQLRQDRLSEALASFKKASAIDDGDTVSLCMAGYVLEKIGRPQQAVQYYSRALKIKPNDELASKLMASVDLHE